jgi:hypothetical protein
MAPFLFLGQSAVAGPWGGRKFVNSVGRTRLWLNEIIILFENKPEWRTKKPMAYVNAPSNMLPTIYVMYCDGILNYEELPVILCKGDKDLHINEGERLEFWVSASVGGDGLVKIYRWYSARFLYNIDIMMAAFGRVQWCEEK